LRAEQAGAPDDQPPAGVDGLGDLRLTLLGVVDALPRVLVDRLDWALSVYRPSEIGARNSVVMTWPLARPVDELELHADVAARPVGDRAEPRASEVIGARIEIVRARRLNVARASSSFAVSSSQPAGRGGGVWQYGVLLV